MAICAAPAMVKSVSLKVTWQASDERGSSSTGRTISSGAGGLEAEGGEGGGGGGGRGACVAPHVTGRQLKGRGAPRDGGLQ